MLEHPRVATYHARQGRISPSMRTVLDTLGARYAPPPGVLVPAPGRDLVLDIGCGHGDAALGYAAAHPSAGVVAIDVHLRGLARLLAGVDAARLTNVWVEHGDAVEFLETRVLPGSVAAAHVFFPDPWPKTRHRGRRLLSEETLTLVANRLSPTGRILVATDEPRYAAYLSGQVSRHGGFVVHQTDRPGWRPLAGFEAKAVAAGRAVIDLRLDRRPSGPQSTASATSVDLTSTVTADPTCRPRSSQASTVIVDVRL